MKARERGDTSSWFGLPRWIALFLVGGVTVGTGFLLWLAAQSLTQSSSLDARRVRALNIAADYIAEWPQVAASIAQTSLNRQAETDDSNNSSITNPIKDSSKNGSVDNKTYFTYLFHPEFGYFKIKYVAGQTDCKNTISISENRMTISGQALRDNQGLPKPDYTYVKRARDTSSIPLKNKGGPVCFTIPDLNLEKVAPSLGSFSHLLLIQDTAGSADQARQKTKATKQKIELGGSRAEVSIESDKSAPKDEQDVSGQDWRNGRVVAWVGPSELPIRRLSDLPALQSEVSQVIEAASATAAGSSAVIQPQKPIKKDALEPFDSRVAGKSYRFYWRPIVLDLPVDGVDATQKPVSYYLVGVAPAGAAPEAGQSRTELLAFALVLFMLISLVPVVKLALLGPVDSMQPIEVAAICLGITAATALGTTMWIGARDVLLARNAASENVAATASALARNIQRDLRDALFSPQMQELSIPSMRKESEPLVSGAAPQPTGGKLPFVRVENTLLLDENGRQAAGTFIKAKRDHVGANFDLSDRSYFKRAVVADFASDTGALASSVSQGPGGIWKDIDRDGLVFDQVRSRTDGAPKTILAAKLKLPQDPTCSPSRDDPNSCRLLPSVVVATFVSWRMVSPRLDRGIRYAVVDLHKDARDQERPVLFHSDPGRAGVEVFGESFDPSTRARLGDAITDPIARCHLKTDTAVQSPSATKFSGIYEQEATLFALARVPCTDWAVVTFKSRRSVDSQALQPVIYAIITWTSLTIFPFCLWIFAALAWGDKAWVWLWPDPTKRKKEAYQNLAIAMTGASLLALMFVAWGSPLIGLLLSSLTALAALGWLGWVHYKSRDESRSKLDHITEGRFRAFAITLLISLAMLPVAALAADGRAYFARVSSGENVAAHKQADDNRLASWRAIARMEGAAPPRELDRPVDSQPCTAAICHRTFTELLRKAAGYAPGVELAYAPLTYWLAMGQPQVQFIEGFTLGSLALLIVVILGLAIWVSMRGLFGFGVAIEAIQHPQLPKLPAATEKQEWLRGLPPRLLVIRAAHDELQALKELAGQPINRRIDLRDEIKSTGEPTLPKRDTKNPKLLLVDNLGMLLANPSARRRALEILEHIVAKQGEPPGFRIVILTSLSPLERLLQSFDREREESDHLDPQRQWNARLERAKHREDMRWSAVFEDFTTYYGTARPRSDLKEKGHIVRLIWEELKYLPDPVVEAMIGVQERPTKAKNAKVSRINGKIADWARNLAKCDPEPRAVFDYLATNLIEHYHLAWSLSSRAERLLLYRIAHGHVPNVEKAYALRTLVKRGLVVLDPYPRTMNRSFAQFVKHVERPETIKDWRRTQEHGFWEAARVPFGLALPLAVGVLVLAATRNGVSVAAVVPLFVAAGPVLLHAITSARRTAAA